MTAHEGPDMVAGVDWDPLPENFWFLLLPSAFSNRLAGVANINTGHLLKSKLQMNSE